jgi:Tfp pilus assembly protein PilW
MNIQTTKPGGGYGAFSGTSAASPVAAGVYALMMSAKPGLQPATYDTILFSTAQDLGSTGWDQYFGNGRVNAANAVSTALATTATDFQPPTVAIASPGGGKVSGLLPIDTTATDNVAVARVELLANGTVVATDTAAPFGATLDTTKYPDGTLNLQARAYDAAGNAASSSTVAVTVANDTAAPTVTIQNPAAGSTVTGTVSVAVAASDNQKVSKISLTIDGKEVAVSYGSTLAYSWPATSTKGRKATTPTSSTLTARAEDPAGNFATKSVTVTKK